MKANNTTLAFIFKHLPEIKENTLIISLSNKALEESFNSIKQDVLEYIRNAFNASNIQIKCSIKKDSEDGNFLSARDRFKYLIKTYPAFQVLSEKLDLEESYE